MASAVAWVLSICGLLSVGGLLLTGADVFGLIATGAFSILIAVSVVQIVRISG